MLGKGDTGAAEADANKEGENSRILVLEDVESSKQELAVSLEKRRSALADSTGLEGETESEQRQILDLLEQLDRVFTDQLRSLRREEDLLSEKQTLDKRLQNETVPGNSLNDQPTFTFLEHLLDERDQAKDAREWSERDRKIALEEARTAEKLFDSLERERRSVREKSEENPGEFLAELRLAQIRSRLAEEDAKLRQHELQVLDLQESLFGPRMELLEPEIAWVRTHLVRSESQMRERERLRQRETEQLEKRVESARESLTEVSAALVRREEDDATESQVLEVWREARRFANQRVSVLSRQLLRVEEFAKIEDQRLKALFDEVERDVAEAWAGENEVRLQQVENQRRQQISELVRSRRQSQVTNRLLADEGNLSRGMKSALEEQKALIEDWLNLSSNEIAALNQLIAARGRLAEELDAVLPMVLPSIGDAWGGTGDLIVGIWEYELFTVDDQPVRVRTILWVLLLVLIGVLVARWFSRAAGNVAESRLKWSRGRAAAWRTLLFYGFMVMIVVTILNLFHFSLTQFSVISGALAVGLGFGSQNLINNFISGIILLIERPIAEGALIELDGDQLWVERIGIRSTVVRSFDNTHIVVPNSRLLEQPVTNWTLSDDVVRQKIRVGVSYGTDTRKAAQIIEDVLQRLDPVLDEPKPMVLFDSFADSALEFLAIFHTRLDDRFEALTEVRHSLVESLGEADIPIAFPQRDVHLDTVRPIEVKLQSESDGSDSTSTEDESPNHGPNKSQKDES
ncbi:MAG: hypothetical protein SynsKO_00730 [Synoicihabitans sp.]